MEPVRVVELIPTMADGGAETLVKDYAILSDREKVDVSIVVWSGKLHTANEKWLEDANIKTVYLGDLRYSRINRLNFIKRIRRKVGRFIDFRRYINSVKPEVIHIHLKFGLFLRFIPIKRNGIKLLYTVHNELDKYFSKRPFCSKWFEYIEAKRLIKRYDLHLIALHNNMKNQLERYFSTSNVITLHNGIDLNRFNPRQYDGAKKRADLGIPLNSLVIGHVGSVHYQKNHEFLIDIYCKYRETHKDTRLLLVGKGNRKEQVCEMIHGRGIESETVFLEGRTDIPELMSAMDVFVMPSRWEGYPVVLIEAQSMGLPCVISDRIDKECILSDNVTMLSLDAGIDAWCSAIDGLEDKSRQVSVLSEYDMTKCIEKLQKLYGAS